MWRELDEKLSARIISVRMSVKFFFFNILSVKAKEDTGLIIVGIDW